MQTWVIRVGQEFRVQAHSADEAMAWAEQLERRVWPMHELADSTSCLWRDKAAETQD